MDRPEPRAPGAWLCPGAVPPPHPRPTAPTVCNERDIYSWLCAESGEGVASGIEKQLFSVQKGLFSVGHVK